MIGVRMKLCIGLISNQKRTYCFSAVFIIDLVCLHIDSVACLFSTFRRPEGYELYQRFPEGLHEEVDHQIQRGLAK